MNPSLAGFRRQIQTADEHFLDFQFDVVHATDKEKFLVSVYEGERKITFFHMQKKDLHWRIINAPKVADRFLQMEKMLEVAIKNWELNRSE